jgi:excisionase family DNA binding protein
MSSTSSDLPRHDLLTPDEVASYLRISRQSVYNWIDCGRLDAVKMPNGGLRIQKQNVIEILTTSE